MSFLVETVARRLPVVPRAAASVPRTAAAAFSSAAPRHKSAAEVARDTLKSVDRAVSDRLVDGINITSTVLLSSCFYLPLHALTDSKATVGNKIKEAGSDVVEGNATGKAAELRGEAKGAASNAAGKTKGTASELEGKARELAGTAKAEMQR